MTPPSPTFSGGRKAGGEASPLVITIDGPAGSGKSTTARAVARELGLRHLDSGALYRALTFALLESGPPPDEWESLTLDRLRRIPLDVAPDDGGFEVTLGGRALDDELRGPEVTGLVSRAASLPVVRGRLLDLQRGALRSGGLVADGRDMGTVVFPQARVKVFLVADLAERARRRLLERTGAEPSSAEVVQEAERIRERDRSDSARAESPLRRPDDALVLDTTTLDFQEQVRAVVERVRALTGP